MSINQSAINLLGQLSFVTNQLSDEEFRKPIGVLSNSSIGQHIRHTLEFFICLMDAKNEGVINYDNRKHDRFIEQEPKLALSVMDSIVEFIERETRDFPLQMEACYDVDKDEVSRVQSNFFRELAYNIEHAIHHMALIKIGVNAMATSVTLPEHFGVASSTVRYHQGK